MNHEVNKILLEAGKCRINCQSCADGEHSCSYFLCECKVTDQDLDYAKKKWFKERLTALYEEDGLLFNEIIREWFVDEMRRDL